MLSYIKYKHVFGIFLDLEIIKNQFKQWLIVCLHV